MSWHFSLALVEAYSRAALSDGGLSAQWRSTSSAGQSCNSDSVMVLSISSRSGMTYAPSPEQLGEGSVDVVSGGFPCQDISSAGTKEGLSGERSGLWVEMARVIREVEPRFAFVENSASLLTRGLDRVLADLAEMGMDARWGVFSAGDVGARHRRERLFIVADRDGFMGSPRPWSELQFRQPANERFCHGDDAQDIGDIWLSMADARARMDDDVAHRVERTYAIGNGQVPSVAAGAWRVLNSSFAHPLKAKGEGA